MFKQFVYANVQKEGFLQCFLLKKVNFVKYY